MPELENNFFHLQILPEQSAFTLTALPDGYPRLVNARLGVRYRLGPRRAQILNSHWSTGAFSPPERVGSSQGTLHQIRLEGDSPDGCLGYRVEFALARQTPIFMWRITLENRGNRPVAIERLTLLEAPAGSIQLSPARPGETAFFANGWQSWSQTGTFGPKDAQHWSGLGPFRQPVIAAAGTPRPNRPGHYASDFFGVLGDRTHRTALVAGFLSQRQHFGSLEARIKPRAALNLWANGDDARLNPHESIQTDWAVMCFTSLDEPDPLGVYIEAVARQNRVEAIAETLTGWCSWYQYFNKVSAEDILVNLEVIASLQPRLPLRLVQIDDGFESAFGDWSSFKPTFPRGVGPLAREIRSRGLIPGLWLAPFIANRRSRLARENPEFFLRNAWGLPVSAGATMESPFNVALDLTHPAALDYAASIVRTAVHDWGFDYLKLDFLYAGGLAGRRKDPTQTRAQALRTGLEALRQAAGPEAYLLGCGVPLGSALGLFQACRIGDDVSPGWKPSLPPLPVENEIHFPSTRNALQNVLARAPLHRRWWVNDADCLIIRPDSKLSLDEVETMASAIALTGGSLVVSDALSALPPDRQRLVQQLLPLIDQRPRILDWFDASRPTRLRLDLEGPAGPWHLLGLFNWADEAKMVKLQPANFALPEGEYWVRSFWDGFTYQIHPQPLLPEASAAIIREALNGPEAGGADTGEVTVRLAPHGVKVLAVRLMVPDEVQYLGGDLHISQGQEISSWQVRDREVRLRLALPRKARGSIELAVPLSPLYASQDGQPIPWQPAAEGTYRFPVDFEGSAVVEFRF